MTKSRVRRPGEVVHQRPLAGRVDALLVGRRRRDEARHDAVADAARGVDHLARGADLALVLRGQVERDVVRAVVGVELRVGVELVAVPAALALEDAELREPVRHEEEVVLVARAPAHARQQGFPLDLELERLPRPERAGQVDGHDRAVERVLVVRRAVAQRARQVARAGAHGGHALPAKALLELLVAVEHAPGLAQVGRAVAGVGVVVEVEPGLARGLSGAVHVAHPQPPGQPLRPVLGALQACLDDVVRAARVAPLVSLEQGRGSRAGEKKEREACQDARENPSLWPLPRHALHHAPARSGAQPLTAVTLVRNCNWARPPGSWPESCSGPGRARPGTGNAFPGGQAEIPTGGHGGPTDNS